MIIRGNAVLLDCVRYVDVEVNGDRIIRIDPSVTSDRQPDLELEPNQLLSPGFIDPQINGGFGKEFKTDSDSISFVSNGIPAFGTTSFLPTITTMQAYRYKDHLTALAQDEHPGARVLGFHLEGPALNEAKRGAHPADWLIVPNQVDLSELLHANVKVLTLAPELAGGWELAREAIKRGVRVGLGHSTASYDSVVENFDETMMHIVHTFNTMPDLSGRQPGLVGVALDKASFPISVIADLVHVHAASIRILWRSHNGSKIFAVSDGSAVLGMEVGVHTIGPRRIERQADRAVLEGTETLVGSVLTMNAAAKNLRAVTNCEIWEAVKFVSFNAAEFLGLSHELGSIEVGKLADLCVIDEKFNVYSTFIGGRLHFARQRD